MSISNTHTAFIPFIKAVGRGEKLKRDLSYEESSAAMRLILGGQATEAQIGAFLIAQRVKGEAVDEILGFTHVLRQEFVCPISPNVKGLLDLAVPYDGKAKTAQLAPAIALILVTAGVPVIMHGDENVPTKSGITPGQLLHALSIATHLPPAQVAQMIEAVGFGFLGAAQFAPAWHELLPIRHQFGLRTVCNTIEKLLNPFNAPYQVSGFFHANYIKRIRATQTGRQQSWIIQGEEGSIEMAAGRRTHVYGTDEQGDRVIDPGEVGISHRERVAVSPVLTEHVALNTAVLCGESHWATEQAVLTAGVILHLLNVASSLAEGVDCAQRLVSSGAVRRKWEVISKQ